MKKCIVFLVLLSFMLGVAPVSYAEETDKTIQIYVSPTGNDSGKGTISSPYQTIEHARNEVRKLNSDMKSNIEVILRGGMYQQEQTLTFGTEDSGSNGYKVIYKAYKGEMPIISGGEKLDDWKLYDASKNIYVVKYDGPFSRQLFVNGKRAVRARGKDNDIPNMTLENDGYTLNSDHPITTWRNPEDIDFFYHFTWCERSIPIQSIEGKKIYLGKYFRNGERYGTQPTFIEHAFELLDEEGEWYFDRKEGNVYYKPRSGESMDTAEVYIPTLEHLINIKGTENTVVKDITFDGITFQHTTWLGPSSEYGFPQMQAGMTIDFRTFDEHYIIGNITLTYTENIEFINSEVSHMGAVGIWIDFGGKNNLIEGCEFFDINSSAVNVGVPLDGDDKNAKQADKLIGNRIKNNYIHDVGIEHMGAAALFTAYTENTEISHNELCHLPYTAISTGWGWGANRDSNLSHDNTISYNHIYDVMTKLDDGGCIYNLDSQPGTRIAGNLVHDVVSTKGCMIYLDDGSRFITVDGNIGYRAEQALSSKGDSNVIINNYFDESFEDTRQGNQKDPGLNTKENNITVKDGNFPLSIIAKTGIEYEWQSKRIQSHDTDNIFNGASARMLDSNGKLLKAVSGSAAGNALDGNTATIAKAMTSKAWNYTVDLGYYRKIRTLNILFDEKQTPKQFNVKISNDGTNWEEAYKAEDNSENDLSIECGDKIARLVQIELVSGSMAIKEISALACDFITTDETEQYEFVTFYDINGHWGKEAVEYAASRGYVYGKGDGRFDPDGYVTRAEFCAILLRTLDGVQKIKYDGRYSDVSGKEYFADYLVPLSDAGIIPEQMIENKSFMPQNLLLREEMAYMLVQATGDNLPEYDFEKFSDISEADEWSVPYIEKAQAEGLVSGNNGYFMPKSSLTRAEAATVIMNSLNRQSENNEENTTDTPEITEEVGKK